eukprot:3354781-Alexandrium_andersonii.AAC.1
MWTDIQKDGRTDRRTDGRTDGRVDGQTDGRMGARAHGRTDARTHARTHARAPACTHARTRARPRALFCVDSRYTVMREKGQVRLEASLLHGSTRMRVHRLVQQHDAGMQR